MLKARLAIKNQRGFTVVEVLLAAAVFGLVVTGAIGALVYGRESAASAGDRARAVLLAEEGVEATRNIAAAGYANLVDGTYGLTQTGNQWVLAGSSDVSSIYTRQVVIGTTGTNRKSVTSTVSWGRPGGTSNVSIASRLVNWAAATAATTSWPNAIRAGGTDVTGTANAVKTATVGNYAYTVLSATTNNFVITDISNPTAPVNRSTIALAGTPTNIAVSGNYAYVTNTLDTAELQVVDISVPTAPTLVASLNMIGAGNGQGVFVSGGFAYVTRASDTTASAFELSIVNLAAPLAPKVSGGYNYTSAMNDVYVDGVNAYVATSSTTAEMLIINVTTPATPTLTATYNPTTATTTLAITKLGNTVLLGTGSTLLAVNVTNLSTPTLLGTFTAAGVVNDVAYDITNQFAFIGTASTTAEFQVVNIGTPASMTLAKSIDLTGTTSAVAGVGYNSSLDIVIGASAADTSEVMVFTKN